MVIDFDRTVAYRCSSCGEIAYGNFSLFELSGGKGISMHCSCGATSISVASEKRAGAKVSFNCVICDENHTFHLPFDALAKKDCNELACPDAMIELGFIGKKAAVEAAVCENERTIAEVVQACGLEHTGKNGILMIKALDKIQDLSESNSLKCKCGSNLIDIEIRKDDIVLECCICGEKFVIPVSEIKKSEFSKISKIIIGQK